MDSTSSLDVLGSMDGLSSTDALGVLEASLAAEPAAESEVSQDEAGKPGQILGMSPAVQGMILLNISAALFGSNQVCSLAPLFASLSLRAAIIRG